MKYSISDYIKIKPGDLLMNKRAHHRRILVLSIINDDATYIIIDDSSSFYVSQRNSCEFFRDAWLEVA